MVNVLMGWGMEDSLSRSDAMRARGYHCGVARTSYQRFRFGPADKCLVAVVLALAGVSAACAVNVLRDSGFTLLSRERRPAGFSCHTACLWPPRLCLTPPIISAGKFALYANRASLVTSRRTRRTHKEKDASCQLISRNAPR